MKIILMAIVSLALSCSSVKEKRESMPFETVENLIIQKKYNDARELLSKEVVKNHQWETRVSNVEKCMPDLEKCEQQELENLNEIRKCVSQMIKNCGQVSENDFPLSFHERYKKTFYRLTDKADNFSSMRLAEQEKVCESGIRWGYFKDKKCMTCAWTIKNDKSSLFGQFLTRAKCEESRILDKEFSTGDACFSRYVGEKKASYFYELIGMKDFRKIVINFNSKEDCEKAQNVGFEYYNADYEKLYFFPLVKIKRKDL